MKRKIYVLLMSAIMVFTMMPTMAFADTTGGGDGASDVSEPAAEKTSTIKVQTVDESGAPVAGVKLYFDSDDYYGYFFTTGNDGVGNYTIGRNTSGSKNLGVSKTSGYSSDKIITVECKKDWLNYAEPAYIEKVNGAPYSGDVVKIVVKKGTAGSDDAAEASYPTELKLKVVDESGNAVEGLVFKLVSLDYADVGANDIILPASNSEGQISKDIAKETYGDDYMIVLTNATEYTYESSTKVNLGYKNGYYVNKFDGVIYDGIEKTITVKKVGGSSSEPVTERHNALKLKAVDKDGKPVKGVKFYFYNEYYKFETNDEGIATYELKSYDAGESTVGIASENYKIERDLTVIASGNPIGIDMVDGKAYNGEPIEIVVTPVGESEDPASSEEDMEITAISFEKTILPKSGGEFKGTIKGSGFTGKTGKVTLTKPEGVWTAPSADLVIVDDNTARFSVTTYSNYGDTDKVYNIASIEIGNNSFDISKIEGGRTELKVSTKSSLQSVDSYTISGNELPSEGGSVKVVLEGQELIMGTYAVDAAVYKGNSYYKDENVTVTTDTKTESRIEYTINFPKNEGEDDVEYRIEFLGGKFGYSQVAVDGNTNVVVKGSGSQTTDEFTLASSDATAKVLSAGIIQVTFKDDVDVAAVVNAKKSAIVLTDGTDDSNNDYALIPGDLVHLDGKTITLDLYDKSRTIPGYVTFGVGTLKNASGSELSKPVRFAVEPMQGEDTTPIITAITFEKTNFTSQVEEAATTSRKFDHNGGTVVATLHGRNFQKGNAIITAEIYENNWTDYTLDANPRVEIINDYTAELTFRLGANSTLNSRRYDIDLYINGGFVPRLYSGNDSAILVEGEQPVDVTGTFTVDSDEVIASNLGNNVVRVRLTKQTGVRLNASTLDEEDAVKKTIYFWNGYDESSRTYLTDEDEIEIIDNDIYIKLNNKPASIASVNFPQKSLLNDKNEILAKSFRSYVNSATHIEALKYDQITFDSNGGHVRADIEGTQLDAKEITATVIYNGETTPSETVKPVVTIKDSENGELTFDVPTNTTGKTETYTVRLLVDGESIIMHYVDNGLEAIAVLAEGNDDFDTPTLSSVSLSGASDKNDAPEVYETDITSGMYTLKVTATLKGTKLSAKNTLVKVVDENGIEWPVRPVEECGATIRWQNSSAFLEDRPEENSQQIELLPPRKIGSSKTYKVYFAVDGKNYDESIYATIIINNDKVQVATELTDGLNYDELNEVIEQKVRYVDETGKDIIAPESYRAYRATELYGLGLDLERAIPGYELQTITAEDLPHIVPRFFEPTKNTNDAHFVKELGDSAILFIYKKTDNKYMVVEGNNQTFDKTKDGVEFGSIRFSRDKLAEGEKDTTFESFTGELYMDGVLVDAENYDASEGSLVVDLHEDYLKTLSVGKHTVTAMFDGGNASADAVLTVSDGTEPTPEVKPADGGQAGSQTAAPAGTSESASDAVKTGDASNVYAYIAMLFAAVLAAAYVMLRRKVNR